MSSTKKIYLHEMLTATSRFNPNITLFLYFLISLTRSTETSYLPEAGGDHVISADTEDSPFYASLTLAFIGIANYPDQVNGLKQIVLAEKRIKVVTLELPATAGSDVTTKHRAIGRDMSDVVQPTKLLRAKPEKV